MTPPGDRMRAIAARLFTARALERLVDPIIADLQAEYRDAVRQDRVWRSRWIRVAGCAALLKAASVYACQHSIGITSDWSDEDHSAFGRTIVVSAVAMIVVTALLDGLPLLNLSSRVHANLARLSLYLTPQAVPIALPVGFTFGVLFGCRAHSVSRRPTRALLFVAGLCSAAAFTMLAWVTPAANQSFRELMFAQLDGHGRLLKGTNELSLGELSQKIDGLAQVGYLVQARNLALDYHTRWALSCATFVLAAFAVTVAPRRRRARLSMLAALVVGTYAAYYALMFVGRAAAIAGTVPVVVGAWLANTMFIVIIAIATLKRRATTDCGG